MYAGAGPGRKQAVCAGYRRATHVERQGSLLKHKVDLLRAAVAADGAAVALEQPALRILALRGGVARVSKERDWRAATNDSHRSISSADCEERKFVRAPARRRGP